MTLQGVSDFYFNRGLKLFEDNDLSNALKAFNTSLELNENNRICLNVMGLCCYKLGKFSEAKAAWVRSSNIDSSIENQAGEYLNSLEKVGFRKLLEDANRALELAVEGNYKDATVLFEKENIRSYAVVDLENIYGLCNYAVGKRSLALKIWREVLSMDRGNEEASGYIIEAACYREEERGLLGWLKNIIKGYRSI